MDKCDNHSARISSELDSTFSTLALVNAPDMDAFMKAIMLMDEKDAECLRGELNHVIVKYLDADEKFRQRFIENNYENFDTRYVREIHAKIIKATISSYENTIKKNLIEMISLLKDFTVFLNVWDHYVLRAPHLTTHIITADYALIDFKNICCKNKATVDHLVSIHNSINEIYSIWGVVDKTGIKTDQYGVDPIWEGYAIIKAIGFTFYVERFDRRIRIRINLHELDVGIITQIVKRFTATEQFPSCIALTLEYVKSVQSRETTKN